MDGIKLKGREGDGFYSEVYIYIYIYKSVSLLIITSWRVSILRILIRYFLFL